MRWIYFFCLLIGISACQPQSSSLTHANQSTQYFLVRHAEKGQDDPKDPTLTPMGQARAQLLAGELAQAGITAIYSTDFQRTRLTAQPLAERLGIPVQVYDAKRDLADFLQEVQGKHGGEKVLIVGHSNTIPDMANILSGGDAFHQFDDADYNHLIIVTGPLGHGVVTDLSVSPCPVDTM